MVQSQNYKTVNSKNSAGNTIKQTKFNIEAKKCANQYEHLYVQLCFHVYIPNFRQTEHLCFPCVPVEDLPQFIGCS